MPHATPKLDWELARTMTGRLLASAPEVHFSYARQDEGVAMRLSRLVIEFTGAAWPMPAELVAAKVPDPLTEMFEDRSRIPFAPVMRWAVPAFLLRNRNVHSRHLPQRGWAQWVGNRRRQD